MKLTSDEAKKLVAFYYANGKSPTVAARIFNNWALHNHVAARITKKNACDAIKRFEQRTTIQKDVRRRVSVSQNEDVLMEVLSFLHQRPGNSLRTCEETMSISRSTVHKVARRKLQLYPYRLLLVQALSDFDKIVRIEACRRLLDIITEEKLTIFTDEAKFRTDGFVNRWNCRCWDYERPDDFVAEQTQSAKAVMVWAGMSKDNLFGPYFFPATVTGEVYRAVLSEIFYPDLVQTVGGTQQVWFQQDGAPAHAAKETLELLKSLFDERIISRECTCEWPPRSPDLAPCDFYLWGAVKDIVYQGERAQNVSELQGRIISAFNMIRQQKMQHVRNAVNSVRRRMELCVTLGGAQLQHEL